MTPSGLKAHADAHWLHWVAFGRLRLCGCGDPRATLERLRDLVDLFHATLGGDERVLLAEELAGPLWEFVVHQLTDAQLLEHRGSARASWATDEGLKFVRVLHEAPVGEADFDAALDCGYSCDGCPAGSVWWPGEPPVAGAGPWAHLPVGSAVPE